MSREAKSFSPNLGFRAGRLIPTWQVTGASISRVCELVCTLHLQGGGLKKTHRFIPHPPGQSSPRLGLPSGAVSSQMIRQGRQLFASRSEPGAGLLFKMLIQVRTVRRQRTIRGLSAHLQEPNSRGAPKESMCFSFLQGITP